MPRVVPALIAAAGTVSIASRVWGVIVIGDQNGGSNSIALNSPSVSILGAGITQYEGYFGSATGTPIAPRYFVTATHVTTSVIGSTGSFGFYNGTSDLISFPVFLAATDNDLAVWEIEPTFTTSFSIYAPLYTSKIETNQPMVVIGHGTARGAAVAGGYSWGGGLSDLSWGTDTVSANNVWLSGLGGSYLQFPFARTTDSNGNVTDPNEAAITGGDSGGGVFVYDPVDKSYKLGGIADYVDLPMDSTGTKIYDSLYDARGYYYRNSQGNIVQYTGTSAIPLSSYAAQISGDISFINNAIGRPTATWFNSLSNHSWSSANNWAPSTAALGAASVAFLTANGAGTVTLDGNCTVGKIYFDSAVSYTIAQGTGGTLTINDATDTLVSPQLNIDIGSHWITAPIALANGVSVNFQKSASLTVSNTISGSGPITVSGTGKLTIGAGVALPAGSSVSVVGGAKLVLAAGTTGLTQNIASLNIDTATASQMDIGNDILNINGTPISNIQAYLASGSKGGGGLISSLGGGVHSIGFVSNGTGGSIVRDTVTGDANLDGVVNFSDLMSLATNFGMTNSTWAAGDFNYDGTTNFTDLLLFATNYGVSLSPAQDSGLSSSFAADWNLAVIEAAPVAVPEPASITGVAVTCGAMLLRRRRLAQAMNSSGD